MYSGSAQGVVERVINVRYSYHYYHYYYLANILGVNGDHRHGYVFETTHVSIVFFNALFVCSSCPFFLPSDR